MPSSYARTLRNIVNDTLRYCNDYQGDGKDGFIWLYSEVASRVNDVLIDLVRVTGILRDTQTIHLQDGVNVYDLPPNCIRPLRFMIHGLVGSIVIPRSISGLDMVGQPLAVDGDPYYFLRNHLNPSQVAFFPTPYRDGSSFTRDSDYGLLRRITDGEGNIPFDGNQPLRRITGVPFVRSGDGGIIREVISPYGNIQVTFVKTPERLTEPDKYPDSDIPEYLHKDLKYPVAIKILRSSNLPLHRIKAKRADFKWRSITSELQRRCEYQNGAGVEPL